MPIGRVPALFIVLTASDADAHAVDGNTRRYRGACASNRTHVTVRVEAIPIAPARFQSREFHMNRVSEFGPSGGGSSLHDPSEPIVLSHFPIHCDLTHRHAAM